MTRRLAITRRQAKTLFAAATEAGGVVEVVTEIGTVRLIPAELAPKPAAPGKKAVDEEFEGYF